MARALSRRGVDARWLLAGDGPDRGEVEAMARNHPGQVELLGTVAAHHMEKAFYQRCHVLLNPSEWETGPIVVWEAMAKRLAVVSSRYTGSGREAALDNGMNCLLYDVGDVEAGAECLERMTDPVLRERLTASADTLVRERYSPEASCASWFRALTEIADSTARCGAEPAVPPAGRLDRWFGATVAENLRRTMPARYVADSPGSEWPHTHAGGRRDDPDHWRMLRALDTPDGESASS